MVLLLMSRPAAYDRSVEVGYCTGQPRVMAPMVALRLAGCAELSLAAFLTQS